MRNQTRPYWADTVCNTCGKHIPETDTGPFTHLDPECEGWAHTVNGVLYGPVEVVTEDGDEAFWTCKECFKAGKAQGKPFDWEEFYEAWGRLNES